MKITSPQMATFGASGSGAVQRCLKTSQMYRPEPRKLRPVKDPEAHFKVEDGTLMKDGWRRRPPEAGAVEITTEELPGAYLGKKRERPVKVEGFIWPASTLARPPAPEPLYPVRVSQGKGTRKDGIDRGLSHLSGGGRETGLVDMQKGHLMALELGGPDIPANIVPQFAHWQATGEWRRMENEMLAEAIRIREDSGGTRGLWYEVKVLYQDREGKTTNRRTGIPTGFEVTAIEKDLATGEPVTGGYGATRSFNQAQNATDSKIAARSALELELMEGQPISDLLDWEDLGSDEEERKKEVTGVIQKAFERANGKAPSDKEVEDILADAMGIDGNPLPQGDAEPLEGIEADPVAHQAESDPRLWRAQVGGPALSDEDDPMIDADFEPEDPMDEDA